VFLSSGGLLTILYCPNSHVDARYISQLSSFLSNNKYPFIPWAGVSPLWRPLSALIIVLFCIILATLRWWRPLFTRNLRTYIQPKQQRTFIWSQYPLTYIGNCIEYKRTTHRTSLDIPIHVRARLSWKSPATTGITNPLSRKQYSNST